MKKRLKILLSAYACEPGKGSEPGVGWNMARHLSQHHEVWVITRANNREVIESEMNHRPLSNINFVYYDLPSWARFWKRGPRGVQLYYYLWQVGVYFAGVELHKKVKFDLVHHVTFVKYWAPSLLSLLPVPFIWGPVGGAECAPHSFRKEFSLRGKAYEFLRDTARWLGDHDPLVRLTAQRSKMAFATTRETAEMLRKIGAKEVIIYAESGLSSREMQTLESLGLNTESLFRFISMGRLLQWKGFHLGLYAFAKANIPNSEYWIVGDGPEKPKLEALARSLGIWDRVKFWGYLPREETLQKMSKCNVLVHPSLHDSGGWVCLEAMAAGRPIICLDIGGPGVQVTDQTGFKVLAITSEQAIKDIAAAMKKLAGEARLLQRLGSNGIHRVNTMFNWQDKSTFFNSIYHSVLKSIPKTGGT